MALISDADQLKLRELFEERLQDPVTMRSYIAPTSRLVVPGHDHQSHTGEAMRGLLDELAALSDRIRVEETEFRPDSPEALAAGIERAPALVLEGHAKGRVRFFGLPSGYEFSTLIEDLLTLSTGDTGLTDETRAALAGIAEPVHVQVFGTPT